MSIISSEGATERTPTLEPDAGDYLMLAWPTLTQPVHQHRQQL